jgi:hypothetical protein
VSRRRRTATVTGLAAGLALVVASTQPAAADNCGDPTDCFATGESFTEALIGLAVTTAMTLLMFTLVGRLLALFGMLAARRA